MNYFILLLTVGYVACERFLLVKRGTESLITHSGIEPVSEQFGIFAISRNPLIAQYNTLSVEYDIEPDAQVHAIDVPWHRQRIVRDTPVYNTDPYPYSESCFVSNATINTYILDTGIDITHPQFGGRAKWSANFADNVDTDCQGHGTHVAGLVGSRDYGVCVDARLYAVKVLDCNGSGSLSGVIKGIDFVYSNQKRTGNVKSVINMSLGGGMSRALNAAVDRAVKGSSDFYIVVAAGNENSDACKGSPSGAEHAFTVMASDRNDRRAYFSNWGACTDIYSPGVDIVSTVPGNQVDTYSGTSMATPIVVGALNMFISRYPTLKNYQVLKRLLKKSKKTIEGKPLVKL